MGENSKTSGELGEAFTNNLIRMIGWKHTVGNLSVACDIDDHLNGEGKSRTTHGEDGLFIYDSPFHDDQTMVVHISVKHSKKEIPSAATLRRHFKNYYTELQQTIQCSTLDPAVHKEVQARRPRKAVSHVGLLVWRHAHGDDRSILGDLSAMELPAGYNSPVFLLDNSRQEFLYRVVNHYLAKTGDTSPNFYYPSLGTRLGVDDRRSGSILPLELASSGIIPLYSRSSPAPVLYLYADQQFSSERYKQLINYALLMGQDLVHEIRIGMPDYDPVIHSADAATARAFFHLRQEAVIPFSFNVRSTNLLEEDSLS